MSAGYSKKHLMNGKSSIKLTKHEKKIQTHFIAAKEKFNLQKGFMTKRVALDKPMQ